MGTRGKQAQVVQGTEEQKDLGEKVKSWYFIWDWSGTLGGW